MPYSNKEYKTSNINYVNKDFMSMKNSLIEYAKTYFPDTYRDFNETSPGMMLIEMAAYVGDVTNFYIDQQYKEMLLPLAQERRNVINIAKMLGYKTKATTPSYVTLKVAQTVGVDSTDINNLVPNYSQAVTIDKGMQVKSSANSDMIFETLDFVDFKVSASLGSTGYEPLESNFDSNGIVNEYTLYRDVLAVAGQTKSKTFSISTPQKYLKLTLPETNVIEILSVTDSNGNKWYEVDYLAQDKVPVETYWINDPNRTTAYSYKTDATVSEIPVPYSLQYVKTSKRFIVDIDETNSTSLIFGNGVLRNGSFQENDFVNLTQVGVTIPGEELYSSLNLDPLNSDDRMTLGESPAHVNLTIKYRVGGGLASNVSTADITEVTQKNILTTGLSATSITVTNDQPAFGGSSGETTQEIKHNAMSFFASQNRCVTKEDYEARIINLPAKFGKIAKVFVDRRNPEELFNALSGSIDEGTENTQDGTINMSEWNNIFGGGNHIPTIDAYVLSYNNRNQLQILPPSSAESNAIAHPLKTNIKNYLSNYRMVTDSISILDGYIINFGVAFEVVAHKSANKADVKLRCINKIVDYFSIDEMQFHQTIYTGDLIYEMMEIEGVRAVNWVELTQNFNDLKNGSLNLNATDNIFIFDHEYDTLDGSEIVHASSESNHSGQYGWKYPFKIFYSPGENGYVGEGIILPSVTPSVFELKNPNKNVRGIVK